MNLKNDPSPFFIITDNVMVDSSLHNCHHDWDSHWITRTQRMIVDTQRCDTDIYILAFRYETSRALLLVTYMATNNVVCNIPM